MFLHVGAYKNVISDSSKIPLSTHPPPPSPVFVSPRGCFLFCYFIWGAVPVCGVPFLKPFALHLPDGPEWTGGNSTVSVTKYTGANITCLVRANPAPRDYVWTFEGRVALPSGAVAHDNVVLIPEVHEVHLGKYTCLVTNTVGNRTFTITLREEAKTGE